MERQRWNKSQFDNTINIKNSKLIVLTFIALLSFSCKKATFERQEPTWTNYETPYSASIIAVDQQNNKWFSIIGYGVSKFDGSHWNTYNADNSGLADDMISSLAIDKNGKIWFGGYNYSNISVVEGY